MRLSLCLEMLFLDRPFVQRMEAAWRVGYRWIEFWDWRDKEIPLLAKEAVRRSLTFAAMSGNRAHSLIDPEARAGLTEEMARVFNVAERIGCHHIVMLSDALEPSGRARPAPSLSWEEKVESMVQGLRVLAPCAEARNRILLLEPLNSRLDHPGCFLNSSALAVEIVRRVASPHVKVLYDVYHMSMMGEDAAREIERNFRWIGYIHVADMPGRHQPGTGTIDYQAIHGVLRRAGYDGYVGMEFSALGSDEEAARVPLEMFA